MTPAETKRHFDELLPWFVNGTLEQSDRKWMEDYLSTHPDSNLALRQAESIRQCVRASAPDIAPDHGYDKLMQRIRSERVAPRKATGPSPLFDRLAAFFRGISFTPALAGAGALVVVQGAVIGGLLLQLNDARDTARRAEYRALYAHPGEAVATPLLRISFKTDAREEDMRAVLTQLGGSFVGGPTSFGDYLVLVDPQNIDQLAQLAGEQQTVEHVAIVRHGVEEE